MSRHSNYHKARNETVGRTLLSDVVAARSMAVSESLDLVGACPPDKKSVSSIGDSSTTVLLW
jgi:hypothetical protein